MRLDLLLLVQLAEGSIEEVYLRRVARGNVAVDLFDKGDGFGQMVSAYANGHHTAVIGDGNDQRLDLLVHRLKVEVGDHAHHALLHAFRPVGPGRLDDLLAYGFFGCPAQALHCRLIEEDRPGGIGLVVLIKVPPGDDLRTKGTDVVMSGKDRSDGKLLSRSAQLAIVGIMEASGRTAHGLNKQNVFVFQQTLLEDVPV